MHASHVLSRTSHARRAPSEPRVSSPAARLAATARGARRGAPAVSLSTGGLVNLLLMPRAEERWFQDAAVHDGTLGSCAPDGGDYDCTFFDCTAQIGEQTLTAAGSTLTFEVDLNLDLNLDLDTSISTSAST